MSWQSVTARGEIRLAIHYSLDGGIFVGELRRVLPHSKDVTQISSIAWPPLGIGGLLSHRLAAGWQFPRREPGGRAV